jgi:hypothetical protein
VSENGEVWDVALAKAGNEKNQVLCVNIPAAVSRALKEAGYTRAALTVGENGILIRPYVGPGRRIKRNENYALPEWS